MKLIILVFLYFGLFQVLVFSQEIPLAEFQLLSHDNLNISILKEEKNSNEATVTYEKQKLSPKVFADVGISDFSNVPESSTYDVQTIGQNGNIFNSVQTSTPTDQRFQRVSLRAGVSIPLFGSRDSIYQDISVAKMDVIDNIGLIVLMQSQMLQNINYAYVEYYIYQLKMKLAHNFMYNQVQDQTALNKRRKNNLMLGSEKIELETMYADIKNEKALFELRLHDDLYRLGLFTHQKVQWFDAVLPYFDVTYATKDYLLSQRDNYPKIEIFINKLETYKNRSVNEDSWFSSSKLELAVAAQSNFSGDTASSVYALLHLQTPFQRIGNTGALYKNNIANVSKYTYALEKQKQSYENAVEYNLLFLDMKKQRLLLAHKYIEVALQSYKEKKLRGTLYKQKVFYNIFTAKYKLYQKTQAYLDAQLEFLKAQINLQSLAQKAEEDTLVEEIDVFYNTNRTSILLQEEIIVRDHAKLSWYSWYGLERFKKSQVNFFKELPPTKRIFLSLSAKEIEAIKTLKYESNTLKELLHQCSIRGIKVDLLLGDPTWIDKNNQSKLLEIIKLMSRYPFKGISLDIEKGMIEPSLQVKWDVGMQNLIKKIKKTSKLPISISINHKNAKQGFLKRMKKAGLNEVIIMYYSKNIKNILYKMKNILKNNPEIACSLALSIEPDYIVDKSETFVNEGRSQALRHWQDLSKALEKNNNFSDLVIQSLKYFYKAEHESKI